MSRLISVVCPSCGSHDIQEDLVCQSCGSRLAWSHDVQSLRLAGVNHQCPGCGRLNDKANRFCASCATPLVLACPVCSGEHPQDTLACPAYGVKLLKFREAVAVLARAAAVQAQARQEMDDFETVQSMQQEIANLTGAPEWPVEEGCGWVFAAAVLTPLGWIVGWIAGWMVMVAVLVMIEIVFPLSGFACRVSNPTLHAIPHYFGHLSAFLVFLLAIVGSVTEHRKQLGKKKERLAELRQAVFRKQARPDSGSRHLRRRQEVETLLGTYAREYPEPVVAQMKRRAGL